MKTLNPRNDIPSSFGALIGVGGVGSGMLLLLEGNHDLGRNESRPARLLDVRDYCKLHIILHYVALMLDVKNSEHLFRIFPIAKLGNDTAGERLLREMADCGLDLQFAETVEDKPTLFSVCYQFPDHSGGNITTSNSAASLVTVPDIDRVTPLLRNHGSRAIVVTVPEVPLEIRHHLLKLATEYRAFRIASFNSSEIALARDNGMLGLIDVLFMNEDEAGALTGSAFDTENPQSVLDAVASAVIPFQEHITIVVTAGKEGAFSFENKEWTSHLALPVKAVNTMGAGDALLAGTLTGVILGLPFSNKKTRDAPGGRAIESAIDLGVLLAAYSTTSPHTIHPKADLGSVLKFGEEHGLVGVDGLSLHV